MNLDELQPEERIALVGLVLAIVDADEAKSDQEMVEFRAIAAEIGRRDFDEAFRHAKSRFPDFESALAYAASVVERKGAQEIIHTVLVDLAAADFIAPAEQAQLDAVAAAWGIKTARDG